MFKEVFNEFFGDVLKLINKSEVLKDLVIATAFVIVGAFLPSTFLWVPTQTSITSFFEVSGFDSYAWNLIGYLLLLILFVYKFLFQNPVLTRKVLIYLGVAGFAYMAYLLYESALGLVSSELQSCAFTSDFFTSTLGYSKSQIEALKKYCIALHTQKLTYSLGLGGILYMAAMAKVIHAGLRIKSTGN